MTNKIFSAIFGFAGLITALSPRYIIPVCEFEGFKRMLCTDTANAELVIGAFLILIALGMAFVSGNKTMRILFGAALVSGIAVIAAPDIFGHCASPKMPCNYGAIPALRLYGIFIIIASLSGFWTTRKTRKIAIEE